MDDFPMMQKSSMLYYVCGIYLYYLFKNNANEQGENLFSFVWEQRILYKFRQKP